MGLCLHFLNVKHLKWHACLCVYAYVCGWAGGREGDKSRCLVRYLTWIYCTRGKKSCTWVANLLQNMNITWMDVGFSLPFLFLYREVILKTAYISRLLWYHQPIVTVLVWSRESPCWPGEAASALLPCTYLNSVIIKIYSWGFFLIPIFRGQVLYILSTMLLKASGVCCKLGAFSAQFDWP